MTPNDPLPMRLKHYIRDHQLEPGMRLPAERQLAAALSVSRSSLREAIQQLISSGVLMSRRGDGTWLRQPQEPGLSSASSSPFVSFSPTIRTTVTTFLKRAMR